MAWAASTAPPVAMAPDRATGPSNQARDLLDQGEGGHGAGMAAGAGGHCDQPVGALGDGFAGEGVVDDVVQDQAAIGVDGLVHLLAGAERGDHDGDLLADADGDVVFQSVVAAVDDLVDGEGGGGVVWMGGVVFGEGGFDLDDPVLQHLGRAGVEGGEAADDAGLALRDDERRVGDEKHR